MVDGEWQMVDGVDGRWWMWGWWIK